MGDAAGIAGEFRMIGWNVDPERKVNGESGVDPFLAEDSNQALDFLNLKPSSPARS